MSHNDTIVAQATPPGRGGVGILRISGLKARDVAQAVLGKLPKPRYADYLPFNDVDGTPLDQGIALWFPGPNSFTGEDVLELQGHGGPVILDLLLKRILTLPGLRIARPGEFSERAFLNMGFHVGVEHCYLLGLKHHHASGLVRLPECACIMVLE